MFLERFKLYSLRFMQCYLCLSVLFPGILYHLWIMIRNSQPLLMLSLMQENNFSFPNFNFFGYLTSANLVKPIMRHTLKMMWLDVLECPKWIDEKIVSV